MRFLSAHTRFCHMFLSAPAKVSQTDVMQRIKGRSSRRIRTKFPEMRQRFPARVHFCTTSGNVTDDIIMRYLE